jgi:molecular chaperone HtpG
MQHAEMPAKEGEGTKFILVDNAMEELLETESATEEDMKIKDLFQEILAPKTEETEDSAKDSLEIEVKNFKNAGSAAYYKVDEQMKRFQQMTKSMGQTNFNMPMKKTLVVNPSNPLVKNVFKLWEKEKQELATKMAKYVQDLAAIASDGLNDQDTKAFVGRSQELISELSNLAL